MKVPKYIKKEMRCVAKHAFASDYHMRKVEEWLEKNGIDSNGLRDGSGCGLVELECGEDITDELCERIEMMTEH